MTLNCCKFEFSKLGNYTRYMVLHRRATQLASQAPQRPHARLNNWTDTNANNIRIFIALLLYQGIIQKPTLDAYWTTRLLLATPYVRYIMTRDTFALLLHCLHFADNTTAPVVESAAERSFQKISVFRVRRRSFFCRLRA